MESYSGLSEFSAFLHALALARGDRRAAAQIVNKRCPRALRALEQLEKAAVPAGATEGTWGAELLDVRVLASSFVESLKTISAFDALMPHMRRAPLRTRLVAVIAAQAGTEAGEGLPKALLRVDLQAPTLHPQKAVGLLVVTHELVRSPEAQTFLLRELRGAASLAANLIFLGALSAAAPSIASSGATAIAVRNDLSQLVESVAAGSGAGPIFLVMSRVNAARLGMMPDSAGAAAFPDAGPEGGVVGGCRALVSDAIADHTVLAVDPAGVSAGDSPVAVDVASAADIAMDDAPSPGPSALTSLWQTDSLACRAERWIAHELLRETAVAALTNVAWAQPGIPS